jgi:hypothetical protein
MSHVRVKAVRPHLQPHPVQSPAKRRGFLFWHPRRRAFDGRPLGGKPCLRISRSRLAARRKYSARGQTAAIRRRVCERQPMARRTGHAILSQGFMDFQT